MPDPIYPESVNKLLTLKSLTGFATCIATAGLLCVSLTINAALAGNDDNQTVNFVLPNKPGGELLLEARETPLDRVLKIVADRTRVPIHYSILPEGLVTATCVGSSLQQIMECLLARKADVAVRYPETHHQTTSHPGNPQPSEIWILGAKFSSANCSRASMDQPSSGDLLHKSTSLEVNHRTELDQTETLLKMVTSSDASERADAIGGLLSEGKPDNPIVKRVLEDALHDANPGVRAQAISSLTLTEGIEASMAALRDALHDNDAEVRLMATDAANDNIELLTEASRDRDETVRNLALSKLADIGKTTNED